MSDGSTLPRHRADIKRAVCAITEAALPLPRGEDCLRISEMEDQLVVYIEQLLQAAHHAR